ncbi:YbaB/EbfC family nucleoid-associated protein [Haloactinomyces albus]|uniref:DNA-binding protein YbaB n=1 Tax=Haloactinomyces albus TaxID=1352928 RepID=A0AAE3ZC71_9ACTN|nr:YbaB/EbfC family nucleoid-associated protein [Haloactinomyces albus]MDR7301013.1 DNA-binding protein YbaB [Haloactinomyces albus]
MDPYKFLEDFENKAGQMQQQLEQSQEAFANARSRASSDDGSVTVAVAGGGSIESLDLGPKAMELGHTKLASTIMATIRKAQEQAAREVQESMRPLLGDGAAMSFLNEQVEAGIARLQPDEEESAGTGSRRGEAPEMDLGRNDWDDDWDGGDRRRFGGSR